MKFITSADVAVIIPVHNRANETARCLMSLREADGAPISVIVVDDGSTDGTAELLNEHVDVITLRGDGALWWTAAIDAGCREAIRRGAAVLVLLNNDNIVAPDLVHTLARIAIECRACVSSVVLERADPSGDGVIFQAGGTLNWRGRGIGLRAHGMRYRRHEELVECAWLPGCALAFPSEVFTAVNGLDFRRFPQYRGDIDFTIRAREAGFRCLATYSTWVQNDAWSQTFSRRVTAREFVAGLWSLRSHYNLRESLRFAWRHCPRWLVPFHLVQFYARYAWASAKTQMRPLAKADIEAP